MIEISMSKQKQSKREKKKRNYELIWSEEEEKQEKLVWYANIILQVFRQECEQS